MRCSLRFYDSLHFPLTPTSPLAAPATAGLGNTCGAPGARGQGARSGPRCPFKGSRNFPLWYQMSLVTSVGRGSGARSEEIGDSSFPGKRRRPRRARVNGASLRGPGRTPRLALTLAGAGRGPALAGQPPPARGGSGDQLAELGAGWGGSGASSSRSGRASFSVLLLRSAAAGPAAPGPRVLSSQCPRCAGLLRIAWIQINVSWSRKNTAMASLQTLTSVQFG